MTDRQVASPGQYKAVVSAAELVKMQSGEEFVVKLTRDDQPLTEGTPYNKESVLPDELAKVLCPDVIDPTPADALAALLPLLGGVMRGNIAMGDNKITDLADATNSTDAVNLRSAQYVAFPWLGFSDNVGLDVGGRGMYLSRSNETNTPVTINGHTFYNGHILSFQTYGNSSCVQIAVDGMRGRLAFRTKWYSNAWSAWYLISGTTAAAAAE